MRFFVHLWEKGWIYRANRIINWCPFHQTSLSDLELAHVETSTTRSPTSATRSPTATGTSRSRPCGRRRSSRTSRSPCTPTTSATATLVGREVIVPWVERRVPVIADERVELDFGTGALKVTPGHDAEGLRDRPRPRPARADGDRADGRMNAEPASSTGLTQEEADERILDWLRERDQLEKREAYRHSVALCERCKTRIEPLISLQWWCSMDELRQPALDGAALAAASASTPSRSTASRSRRSRTRPDWNISRQIWWGHQLPLW